jgi:glycosyltransferase involved in cell wall biosynthesis
MRSVVWIGRFLDEKGFATATRSYVRSLIPYINNLLIAPMEVLPADHEFAKLTGEIDDEDLLVVNHLPTTDPEAEAYFSVWEYDVIPKSWAEILEQAKLIMTQSNFCKEIFSNSITDPSKIKIIPYILGDNFINYTEKGTKTLNFQTNEFIFGSIFEWVPRKAPERLIQAFLNEFQDEPKVKLVLRTILPTKDELVKQLGNFYSDFESAIQKKQIIVYEAIIRNLEEFYRSLNSYISPTAGEGWSQTLSEAMACGLPTIASRHSGNLDFMNDRNSYLVDVHDWSPAEPLPFLPNHKVNWKLPVIESIQEKMREVYQHWEKGKVDPKVSEAIKIRQKLTPEKIGPLIFEAIQKIQ